MALVGNSRWARPAWRLLAVALAVAAGTIGALEMLIRRLQPDLAANAQELTYQQFIDENARPYFRVEAASTGNELIQTPTVWKIGRPRRYRSDKSPGTRRILVIGESSADRIGDLLAKRIAGSELDERFEVMNCAVSAGSLELVRRRFHECARYEPDAVVFIFGHNLFYRHQVPPAFLLPLARLCRTSFLLRWIARRLPWQPPKYRESERLAALQTLIREIAEAARSRKIPVVLSTLPSNLWFVPVSIPRDRFDPDYLEAQFLFHSGRKKEALARLDRAARLRPVALWLFTLGEWHFQAGDYVQARRLLRMARDASADRDRASTAVNELLRSEAARQGLLLVDESRRIEERAPHGIPGWERFVDQQHLNLGFFEVWARESLSMLRGPGWIELNALEPSASPAPDPLLKMLPNALNMIRLNDETKRKSLVYLLRHHLDDALATGDPPFPSWKDNVRARAVLLCNLAEALWRAGRSRPALRVNESLQSLGPDRDEALLQRALFQLESGDRERAQQSLEQALAANPKRADARYFLRKLTEDPVPVAPEAPTRTESPPSAVPPAAASPAAAPPDGLLRQVLRSLTALGRQEIGISK